MLFFFTKFEYDRFYNIFVEMIWEDHLIAFSIILRSLEQLLGNIFITISILISVHSCVHALRLARFKKIHFLRHLESFTGYTIKNWTHYFNHKCSHDRNTSNVKNTFNYYYKEVSFEVYNFSLCQLA